MIEISWRPREVPLVPRVAVARGDAARALARRLRALDDAALAALDGAAGDGVIAVAGAADALPWVDGVIYLGRDDAAPALLVPTALAPELPVALVERAIRAWLRGAATPIAIVHGDGAPTAVLPLGGLRPIDRAYLEHV